MFDILVNRLMESNFDQSIKTKHVEKTKKEF